MVYPGQGCCVLVRDAPWEGFADRLEVRRHLLGKCPLTWALLLLQNSRQLFADSLSGSINN